MCAGNSKAQALLHGHSYTAHPIGCAAAIHALKVFTSNPNLCSPEKNSNCKCESPCGRLLPLWDDRQVQEISHLQNVKGVFALGTILSIQMKSSDSSGYESNAAAQIVEALSSQGIYARPLGDVVYLMVTPLTSKATCDNLMMKLKNALSLSP